MDENSGICKEIKIYMIQNLKYKIEVNIRLSMTVNENESISPNKKLLWSKSEREHLSYINAYMWNLEKWYRWYLQSRNRHIDVESNVWILRKEGKWEELEAWDWHTHIIDTMYNIDNSWEHAE